MADNQPDILPLVPSGYRCCSDYWKAFGSTNMAIVCLLCCVSVHIGAEVNGESPSEVVQSQPATQSPFDRAWESIAELHEVRIIQAMEAHNAKERQKSKAISSEETGG